MNSGRWAIVAAFAVGITTGVIAGCQTYDFQPVPPLALKQTTYKQLVIAKSAKPNVMLLVDKSGSMDLPADPTSGCVLLDGGACHCQLSDGGLCGTDSTRKMDLCNVDQCPTRWWSLQTAIGDFLQNNATVARFGMATMPTSGSCGVGISAAGVDTVNGWRAEDLRADIVQQDDDASLTAQAATLRQILLGIHEDGGTGDLNGTGGGTPTELALSQLAQLPSLHQSGRGNFILLLTDGTPNCNPYHAWTNSPDSGYDKCQPEFCSDSCLAPFYWLGCLDGNATISQVATMKTNNIGTFAVGFGTDTASGAGPAVLNGIAVNGGFPRLCPDGGDGACGANDTCNRSVQPWTCSHAYYQASNEQQLAAALAKIGTIINTSDPCLYRLTSGAPTDPSLLSVLINGVLYPPNDPASQTTGNTWYYTTTPPAPDPQGPSVVFTGSLCAQVSSATATSPIDVEIRVAESL